MYEYKLRQYVLIMLYYSYVRYVGLQNMARFINIYRMYAMYDNKEIVNSLNNADGEFIES